MIQAIPVLAHIQILSDGKIEQTQKLNPRLHFAALMCPVVYHPNGNTAWIFPYTDRWISYRTCGGYV